jgi:hypothetical protein
LKKKVLFSAEPQMELITILTGVFYLINRQRSHGIPSEELSQLAYVNPRATGFISKMIDLSVRTSQNETLFHNGTDTYIFYFS